MQGVRFYFCVRSLSYNCSRQPLHIEVGRERERMSSSGVSLLLSKDDRYNGVIIEPACLPSDPASFIQCLGASLSHWKSLGKKGVWLKLPLKNANLAYPAVEAGFGYHHAEPDYLMLTYWIPETSSTLPANASHQVGVGAVVINDKKEVLVVQEASGPMQGSGIWKFPTGVILQSEDIKDGVLREVKEETGVECEFMEVLAFRQVHGSAFGKSDLFFLCMLRPSTSEIVIQETEIADAKWMRWDEFRAQPFYSTSTMLTRMADIADAYLQDKYRGFSAEKLQMGFRAAGSYLYHNMRDINGYLGGKGRLFPSL